MSYVSAIRLTSILGNTAYDEKRLVYEQSDFQITRAIATHYNVWNEQKIEARQRQLATVAADIWRINFEN